MKTSPSIAALGPALVKAQSEIKAVPKESVNPHFRSRFASLDAITDGVKPALVRNGLAVVQGTVPTTDETGELKSLVVETMLIHSSGEWISNGVAIPLDKATAQGAGSAITYGRRYGLAALLAITNDDDDDGNEATSGAKRESGASVVNNTRGGEQAAGASALTPACPKCSGKMYDNRANKKNPKAPDFKCMKPGCDGIIWPPKAKDDKRPVATDAGLSQDPESYPEALVPSGDDLPF